MQRSGGAGRRGAMARPRGGSWGRRARWWARAAARPRGVWSAREGRAGCGAAATAAAATAGAAAEAVAAGCGGECGVCLCVCHAHRHNQDKVRVRPFAERQILERSAKVRY